MEQMQSNDGFWWYKRTYYHKENKIRKTTVDYLSDQRTQKDFLIFF
jgi:hypothetical protein